jgi:riboflavin synthase
MAPVMFTGLIEAVGTVVSASRRGPSVRLGVDLGGAAEGVRPGDSIALAGCCQTVAALAGRVAEFDAVAETLARTTVGRWGPGTRLNLERAVRPGDRLGGHFVSGHVDATGTVLSSGPRPDGWWLRVEAPPALLPEIAPKGSLALDGVSLTVVEAEGAAVSVTLVPVTLAATTLGSLRTGDLVNLETDLLAKYVRRALGAAPGGPGDARLLESLRRGGFLE